MAMTKIEELKGKVAGTNFHINLEDGAELTEEIAEDALRFINFVKEKKEVFKKTRSTFCIKKSY